MNLHTGQSRRQFIKRTLATTGTLGLTKSSGQIEVRDRRQIDPKALSQLRARLNGGLISQGIQVMTQRDTSIIGIPTRTDDPPWLHVVPTPMMFDTPSNLPANMDWKSPSGAGAIVIWVGASPTTSSSTWPG